MTGNSEPLLIITKGGFIMKKAQIVRILLALLALAIAGGSEAVNVWY
jgi:hypothetical protein